MTEHAPDVQPPASTMRAKHSQWWRLTFSLRTLLVVTTLLGVLLGRAVHFHRQREAAEKYFGDRRIDLGEIYRLQAGSGPWDAEVSYLLTGKTSSLRVTSAGAASDYYQLYLNSGETLPNGEYSHPLDDHGVRLLRLFRPYQQTTAVDVCGCELKATSVSLTEAPPIPVTRLDMPAREPRWLKLFEPRECRISGRGSAEFAQQLEQEHPALHLHILDLNEWAEELMDYPQLCLRIRSASCEADRGQLAAQRAVLGQAKRIKQLTISASDLPHAVQQLGPLSPSLDELLLFFSGKTPWKGGGLGVSLRTNLGERTHPLKVCVILPPTAQTLDDRDMQEFRGMSAEVELSLDARARFSTDCRRPSP